ncbi:MAG: three-helix bundle dimerization domain-containing protein [Actinomycetota bacterium]
MPIAGAVAVCTPETNSSPAATAWSTYVTTIVQRLQTRVEGDVDSSMIAAEVEAAFAAYSRARITQFVPVLVESRVRARLCQRRSG